MAIVTRPHALALSKCIIKHRARRANMRACASNEIKEATKGQLELGDHMMRPCRNLLSLIIKEHAHEQYG